MTKPKWVPGKGYAGDGATSALKLDVAVEYPICGYGQSWATGIVRRSKIWPDREEIEDTHPDGRIERHTFYLQPERKR